MAGNEAGTRGNPRALDFACLTVCLALAGVDAAGVSGPARVLLALAFTLYVPGRAIVATWPRMALGSLVAVPVALSLAIVTLLALISLWAHLWYPTTLFAEEATVSAAAIVVAGVQRERRARAGTAGEGPRAPVPPDRP